MILDAVIGMWKKGVKDGLGVLLCLGAMGLSLFTDISPILLVAACALLGIVATRVRCGLGQEDEE